MNQIIDYYTKNNLPIIYIKQRGMGNLHKTLHYSEKDSIFQKNEPSAFSSNDFCNHLNNLNPKSIVVTGLMTQACVQATVTSALEKDYSVVLVEDGHDSIIKPMRSIFNKKLKDKGAKLVLTEQLIKD